MRNYKNAIVREQSGNIEALHACGGGTSKIETDSVLPHPIQ